MLQQTIFLKRRRSLQPGLKFANHPVKRQLFLIISDRMINVIQQGNL
jgi:hypothetical protein